MPVTVGETEYEVIARQSMTDGFLKLENISIKVVENNTTRIIHRLRANRGNAVACLVFNPETKKFYFVEQYRPGVEDKLLEVVAGSMDVDGEPPIETMKREIAEEIGYETDNIKLIHEYYSSPGSLTEKMYVFYAEVRKKTKKGGGVGDERLQTVELTFEELKNTEFQDGKTLVAVLWALRQPFE